MKKKLFALCITLAVSLGLSIALFTTPTYATSTDWSDIITRVQMLTNGNDQFGQPAAAFSEASLNIELSYTASDFKTPIQQGDTLSVALKPEDTNKDFIQMEYRTSVKNELVDSKQTPPIKVADLDMTDLKSVNFTFTGEAENFDASLDLPFSLNKQKVYQYFAEHPDEDHTEITYQLEINGSKVSGKTVTYTINKPTTAEITQSFIKTSGIYNQVGDLGDGYFVYNIKLATELSSPNEYVIYDACDTNMGFDGYIQIYDAASEGGYGTSLFQNTNTDPSKPYTSSVTTDSGVTIKVYDVYYVTKDPEENQKLRLPSWEEKELIFEREGNESTQVKSVSTVYAPQDILFEKPLGSALSAEETAQIEAAGGLYTKVGKGFKVTITDYKSTYADQGGYITINYHMEIKNPSPLLNDDNDPVYENYATYYAQEIGQGTSGSENPESGLPDLGDPSAASPKYEKSKEGDFGSPYTSSPHPAPATVTPGTLNANVYIPEPAFTKVEADANGDPLLEKPLAGAVFTIYTADANNTKGQIAQNKDGVLLENLVTNTDGKLTKNNEVVKLTLSKGYYVFSEVASPDGYTIVQKDTPVTIGYKSSTVTIANKKDETETPKEPTEPTDPTEPVEPEEPTSPTEPVEPKEPSEPIEPEPSEPEEPVQPTDPVEPSEPIEPVEPNNPPAPTEPAEPSTPEEPKEPVDPSEPTEPTTPEKPSAPDASTPDKPQNPNPQKEESLPKTGTHPLVPLAESVFLCLGCILTVRGFKNMQHN